MLKKEITYEDFNGEEVTETLYFNLTKTELIELEAEFEGGLQGFIQRIVDTKDNKELISQFKRIILLSYGQKSADGRRFNKSDEMRAEFEQTAAFDEMFISVATDESVAAEFVTGIVPRDLARQMDTGSTGAVMPPPPATPQEG